MEIPADYKICKKRVSDECIKLGPTSVFEGRTCKKCSAIYKAAYYQKNKTQINARVIANWRAKRDKQKLSAQNIL